MLMKAIAAFFILVYIHISYSQTPATCLAHLKTEGWPKDGILRVEILRPGEVKVPLKEGAEDMSEELTMLRSNHKGGMVSIDPSNTLPHEEQMLDPTYKHHHSNVKMSMVAPDQVDANQTLSEEISITKPIHEFEANFSEAVEIDTSESVSSTVLVDKSMFSADSMDMTDSDLSTKEAYRNETIAKIHDQQYEEVLKTDIPEVEKLMNAGRIRPWYCLWCS